VPIEILAPSSNLFGWPDTNPKGYEMNDMPTTHEMVENIKAVYRQAYPHQHIAGMEWYEVANSLCQGWSKKYNVTFEQAAGVLAGISPRLAWNLNVAYCERILATGTAPIMHGTLAKVRRILAGEHPADVLGGRKVMSFYANIVSPQFDTHVTVDRHAFDIAVGKVGDDKSRKVLDRKGMYEYVADAYRAAAGDLGVAPCQVQAVTWVVWRDSKGGK